jgi:hypothetical protein
VDLVHEPYAEEIVIVSNPAGHRDCRVWELLGALTDADLHRAVESADPDELASLLRPFGVTTGCSPDAVTAALRNNLGSLPHEMAHDFAVVLCLSAGVALARRVADGTEDLAVALARGPLVAATAEYPPGLLKLSLEVLWHTDKLRADERDALIHLLDDPAPSTAEPPLLVTPPSQIRPTPVPSVVNCGLDALDRLVGKATAVAIAAPDGDPNALAEVQAALKALLSLDPSRAAGWFHYGMVVARLGADDEPAAPPDTVRPAFLLGRLQALAERADDAAIAALVDIEAELVERVLAALDAAPVVAAVLRTALGDPVAFARLLDFVPASFPGGARVVAAARQRAAELAAEGMITEAEAVLQSLEEALCRWAAAADDEEALLLQGEASAVAAQRTAQRRAGRDSA